MTPVLSEVDGAIWANVRRAQFLGALRTALVAAVTFGLAVSVSGQEPSQSTGNRASQKPSKARGQATPAPEYQVKSVFLFNLAQFVDWPTRTFPDAESPLVIGVLGEDPFGAYLDETLRGEKVKNRPLVLQRYRRVSEIKNCYMLFISRSENDRLDQIIAALKGRSILTVSDADDFVNRGGMIQLVTERNKIRIRIGLDAVRAARLTVSSKLLHLTETE